jgi:hypothetical protein
MRRVWVVATCHITLKEFQMSKSIIAVIKANGPAIVEAMKSDNVTAGKWKKVADVVYAEGVRAHHVDPKDEAKDTEAIAYLKECAVLSFGEVQRKLLATETKTLDDFGKFQKKTLQQRIGALTAKISGHLKKLEAKEDGVEDAPKTPAQRIQKLLDEVITKLGKIEGASFSVPDAVKAVRAVKAIVPAV